MCELLAPAGDLEKLKYAINYGADAVYLGGKSFSMRANASNFDLEEIKTGCEYAHSLGKKVYVTLNISARFYDFPRMEKYIKDLEEIGIDGVIISDPGVILTVREIAPNLKISLSTQASTTNFKSLEFWKKNGVSRVVLARELSFEDIENICKNKPSGMEVEVFIHGAMCISYSGRCLINYIDKLIEAGVDSFKIEGRMKSIFYVATVVNAYRKAIDSYKKDPTNYTFDESLYLELEKVSHRKYTKAFFDGLTDESSQNYGSSSYTRNYDFIARVVSFDKSSGLAKIQQRNKFSIGEEIEVLRGNEDSFSFVLEKLYDEDKNLIESAPHPKQILYMDTKGIILGEYDLLRRKTK